MPYESRAQQRKFHVLQREGKIDADTVREFDHASKGKKLPDHKQAEYRLIPKGVYTVKRAGHAHDRLAERTDFHRSAIASIQKSVDAMKLPQGSYHLPLRDKDGNVAGYAVFKGVLDRPGPVLSTVYGKHMLPPGKNIEETVKESSTK